MTARPGGSANHRKLRLGFSAFRSFVFVDGIEIWFSWERLLVNPGATACLSQRNRACHPAKNVEGVTGSASTFHTTIMWIFLIDVVGETLAGVIGRGFVFDA